MWSNEVFHVLYIVSALIYNLFDILLRRQRRQVARTSDLKLEVAGSSPTLITSVGIVSW